MGSVNYVAHISVLLIQFHLRYIQCLISDFYVPGTLIAGPDLSQIYPSEIFVSSKTWAMLRQASNVTETTSAPTAIAPVQTFQCEGTKFIQCSDCNKYAVCTGLGAPLTEVDCGADTPFCNERVEGDFCSRPPVNNQHCIAENPSTFVCTSIGYFPNLENCRMYHICARDATTPEKLVASDYICPQGYYFSVEIKACRRQFLSRECTRRQQDCSNTTPEPAKYDPSPQYYYFCTTTATKPVVFRCPDNSQYRASDYECKYRCRRQGNFAHSDNQRRYFVCFFESRRLTSRIEECAEGFVYDRKQANCVDKTLL